MDPQYIPPSQCTLCVPRRDYSHERRIDLSHERECPNHPGSSRAAEA